MGFEFVILEKYMSLSTGLKIEGRMLWLQSWQEIVVLTTVNRGTDNKIIHLIWNGRDVNV